MGKKHKGIDPARPTYSLPLFHINLPMQ